MGKQGQHVKEVLSHIQPEYPKLSLKFGNLKSFRNSQFFIYRKVRRKGKAVVSFETPVIGRKQWCEFPRNKADIYVRIGLWNSCTFHRGGFVLPDNPNTDRLAKVLSSTRMGWLQPRSYGENVVYLLQHPTDTSLQGVDVEAAAIYDLQHLLNTTGRPIVVSTHPFSRSKLSKLRKFCEIAGIEYWKGPTEQLYLNAWCTVSHSSGAAVEGLIYGIPAITLSRGSFAYEMSSHHLNDIEDVSLEGRELALSRLAYCQWRLSEIREGIDRLEPLVEKYRLLPNNC